MSDKIDFENIGIVRQYVSGITLANESIRRYKYSIEDESNKKLDGKVFYSETVTPKDAQCSYGYGVVTYFENNETKAYKSIKRLLKSMNK